MNWLARFLLNLLVVPGIVVLLFFLPEAILGITPGKILMRLRVRSASVRSAHPLQLAGRYILKSSPFLILLISVLLGLTRALPAALVVAALLTLGDLFVIGDARRSLHDYLSGTAVYEWPST